MDQIIKTSRTFLALVPDEPSIAKLTDIMAALRHKLMNWKIHWVKPRNLHLTLRFIGPLAEEKILILKQAITKVLTDVDKFRVTLRNPHLFPSKAKPRVLAMYAEPVAKLFQVTSALEIALQSVGIPQMDRPFRSHLTLGRIKSKYKIPSAQLAIYDEISFCFDEVVLLASLPVAEGVSYHPLAVFNLAGQ